MSADENRLEKRLKAIVLYFLSDDSIARFRLRLLVFFATKTDQELFEYCDWVPGLFAPKSRVLSEVLSKLTGGE